jgi:hypothetical protein
MSGSMGRRRNGSTHGCPNDMSISSLRLRVCGLRQSRSNRWDASSGRRVDLLRRSVRDVFLAVGLQTELTPAEPTCDVLVGLGDGKRLLVSVTGTEGNVTNKSTKIKPVFQPAQELNDGDQVVFVRNVHRGRPVADREWRDPVSGDAMMVLKGLGVVFATTATLFCIWTLSRENQQAATDQMGQLHAAAPGSFALETASAELAMEAEGATESGEAGSFANRLVNALKA